MSAAYRHRRHDKNLLMVHLIFVTKHRRSALLLVTRPDSLRLDSTRENADSIGSRVDRRRAGRAEGRKDIVRNIWKIERDWLMRRYLKPAGDILYIRKLTAKIGMTR